MSTREKRVNKAAKTFRSGRSRTGYVLRSDIIQRELSLEDFKDVFNSFIHTGQELKLGKKIRLKTGTIYYDL